ncbi:hypothetical protein NT2_05_02350 [Caenibius tardaugens NBRC 16725]|uniref:Peptidase inhibitor I78 family protein n=1 Tax=Caenibius tardaugens NBRC 16725 TaxID=1219035 RepID=U2YL54_9SPHN|nr:I78 family peptidase inhibitor [Caenibius tardaugens]AZI36658.1 hypothetical protein EGO55_12415 [Caenibius tardaugens NBRC 16725]GAD49315.1 hypothetical protein NT2_05_02350 [Caenibius tardaugens NBRC 16725]
MTKTFIIALPALLLAGCAASEPPATHATPPGTCNAEPAQSLVGSTASEAVGAELLKLTGANQLRWGPPRTPMTMDYRHDRLTVAYDDNLKIERITCG